MEIATIVRLIRRSWLLLLSACLVGAATGFGVSAITPPRYVASTQLYVSVASGGSTNDLLQGGTAAEQKVQSYVAVATSSRVLEPVITRLQLHTTPVELARRVTASTPLQSVIIDIHVTDSRAAQSARIANAIAASLARIVVDELETSAASSETPVHLTVVTPAATPLSPSSPDHVFDLGVGALAGAFVAFTYVALRRPPSPTHRVEAS